MSLKSLNNKIKGMCHRLKPLCGSIIKMPLFEYNSYNFDIFTTWTCHSEHSLPNVATSICHSGGSNSIYLELILFSTCSGSLKLLLHSNCWNKWKLELGLRPKAQFLYGKRTHCSYNNNVYMDVKHSFFQSQWLQTLKGSKDIVIQSKLLLSL